MLTAGGILAICFTAHVTPGTTRAQGMPPAAACLLQWAPLQGHWHLKAISLIFLSLPSPLGCLQRLKERETRGCCGVAPPLKTLRIRLDVALDRLLQLEVSPLPAGALDTMPLECSFQSGHSGSVEGASHAGHLPLDSFPVLFKSKNPTKQPLRHSPPPQNWS